MRGRPGREPTRRPGIFTRVTSSRRGRTRRRGTTRARRRRMRGGGARKGGRASRRRASAQPAYAPAGGTDERGVGWGSPEPGPGLPGRPGDQRGTSSPGTSRAERSERGRERREGGGRAGCGEARTPTTPSHAARARARDAGRRGERRLVDDDDDDAIARAGAALRRKRANRAEGCAEEDDAAGPPRARGEGGAFARGAAEARRRAVRARSWNARETRERRARGGEEDDDAHLRGGAPAGRARRRDGRPVRAHPRVRDGRTRGSHPEKCFSGGSRTGDGWVMDGRRRTGRSTRVGPSPAFAPSRLARPTPGSVDRARLFGRSSAARRALPPRSIRRHERSGPRASGTSHV